MGFQGITQHGKFAWCGLDQAVEEVINLGGIDGEKGEAGMEFLARIARLFSSSLLSRGIDPLAVFSHRRHDVRDLRRVRIEDVVGPTRLPGWRSDSR